MLSRLRRIGEILHFWIWTSRKLEAVPFPPDSRRRAPTLCSPLVHLWMSGIILESVQEGERAGGRQIELTKVTVAIQEYPYHQLSPPLALPITRTSQYEGFHSRL